MGEYSISEFAKKLKKQTIDRILSVEIIKLLGISTGLKELRYKMTGGLFLKQLWLRARPSMGKTALIKFAKQASKSER